MKFSYTCYTARGERSAGTLEAASLAEARDRLRRDGLHVAELREYAVGQAAAERRSAGGGGGSRLSDVAGFMKQLSILMRNGTPLADGLAALERECRSASFRPIVTDIRTRVEEGGMFSDALGAHPRSFDAISRSLVRAGESTGRLDEMLARVAQIVRKKLTTRKQIIAAMVYPILLSTVAVAVLVLMIVVVVPRFADLFQTLGVPLPATTKLLVGISHWVHQFWIGVIIGAILLIVGIVLFLKMPSAKSLRDLIFIRLPQFGKIIRSFSVAQISRLLGMLVTSGVPLLEALSLTSDAASNSLYKSLIQNAEDRVSRGEALSDALSGSPLVSPSYVEAVRNAELSGKLGDVLLSLADVLDEDNEITVRSLSSIIEPLILVVLGLVVGLVAMSMFIPLFDLTAMTGTGGPS